MTSLPIRTALLSADQQSAVTDLVAAAREQDGVTPLSEQSMLAVRGAPAVRSSTTSPTPTGTSRGTCRSTTSPPSWWSRPRTDATEWAPS